MHNLATMRGLLILVCIIVGLCFSAFGQQDYSILLKSGAIEPTPLSNDFAVHALPLHQHLFDSSYHLILQFHQIPNRTLLKKLEQDGIELLQYIPNYAYLTKIPINAALDDLNIRAILPLQTTFKLATAIDAFIQRPNAERLEVQVLPYPSLSLERLRQELTHMGFSPKIQKTGSCTLQASVDQLKDLALHPAILFIDLPDPEPAPEGLRGRSLHGLGPRSVSSTYPFDGTGVSMAIGDDGAVHHEDFKGRIIDHTEYNYGNHGDMTAGLAIGAGNLDPFGRGMATGASLHLYGIGGYTHLLDAPANLQQYGTVITSTSYGEGCGGIYSASAQAIDQQVSENEAILHVFSTGNSAQLACSPTYQNVVTDQGVYYGNITGGRKAAKNVLAIGNLNYDDQLRVTSSRGPTEDGRIKPDLCAHGQENFTTDEYNTYRWAGGTSAAAPVAAGVGATLYQAYKEFHNGELPDAALIKAVLLNTAEDLGRTGPDYDFGWGRINADKALQLLQQEQHSSATITQDGENTHEISLPAGIRELKVLVYWTDAAGSPMASSALVNDLDIRLESPNGSTFYPWVLSTFPHLDSLTKPAVPGLDHINNMEQVSLQNPEAGSYTLKVKGHIIPMGTASYQLVYWYQDAEIRMRYPTGGEGFVPGEIQVVRWDAHGQSGTFSLEYSIDNMDTWQLIADNLAGDLRHYEWLVPADIFGKAHIRVNRNGQNGFASSAFSIIGQADFTINPVNGNSARVSWESVNGATHYDLFSMGAQYMEIIGSTDTTFFELSLQPGEERWYSIRARKDQEIVGRRTRAKAYLHEVDDWLYIEIIDLENIRCHGENNGAIAVQAHGGTGNYNYSWNYGLVGPTINNLYAGNYAITVSDEMSEVTFDIDLEEPLPLDFSFNVINASCFGHTDGGIAVELSGGMPPYQAHWSNGAEGLALSNLQAGIYELTVTDANDCQEVASVAVTENLPLEIELLVQESECQGLPNGVISTSILGGASPYSYLWSDGSTTEILENLPSGWYEITVIDANGCAAVKDIQLENEAGFGLDFEATAVTCFGGNDGAIELFTIGGQGPFTILWNTGANSLLIDSLEAGVYSVTVIDAGLCISTQTILLTQQPPLDLSLELQNATEQVNGSIDLSVEGGLAPYTYSWSNGAQTEDLAGLAAGYYAVTVSDAHGCTQALIALIEGNPTLYCASSGENTGFEWIQSVQLGTLDNTSGPDGGYADYTALNASLQAGESYVLTLTPGYAFSPYTENWRIWADWNADGDFEDEGEVLFTSSPSNTTIEAIITMPESDTIIETRMRVSMEFGNTPDPCGTFFYGETEDYTILLNPGSSYCSTSGGSTTYEWIESVTIGDFSFTSGNNDGYGDYSEQMIFATAGETLPVLLLPMYSSISFREYWNIWIDFDEDGFFDEEAELLYRSPGLRGAVEEQITLPMHSFGAKRLRISMKWGANAQPCEQFSWGEVEDYTIYIQQASTIPSEGLVHQVQEGRGGDDGGYNSHEAWGGKDLSFYPNPACTFLLLQNRSSFPGPLQVHLFDINGLQVIKKQLEFLPAHSEYKLSLDGLAAGTYILVVQQGPHSWKEKIIIVPNQETE